jgi:hypothetical protein
MKNKEREVNSRSERVPRASTDLTNIVDEELGRMDAGANATDRITGLKARSSSMSAERHPSEVNPIPCPTTIRTNGGVAPCDDPTCPDEAENAVTPLAGPQVASDDEDPSPMPNDIPRKNGRKYFLPTDAQQQRPQTSPRAIPLAGRPLSARHSTYVVAASVPTAAHEGALHAALTVNPDAENWAHTTPGGYSVPNSRPQSASMKRVSRFAREVDTLENLPDGHQAVGFHGSGAASVGGSLNRKRSTWNHSRRGTLTRNSVFAAALAVAGGGAMKVEVCESSDFPLQHTRREPRVSQPPTPRDANGT